MEGRETEIERVLERNRKRCKGQFHYEVVLMCCFRSHAQINEKITAWRALLGFNFLMQVVWDIMRCWVQKHPLNKKRVDAEKSPGTTILDTPPTIQANFARPKVRTRNYTCFLTHLGVFSTSHYYPFKFSHHLHMFPLFHSFPSPPLRAVSLPSPRPSAIPTTPRNTGALKHARARSNLRLLLLLLLQAMAVVQEQRPTTAMGVPRQKKSKRRTEKSQLRNRRAASDKAHALFRCVQWSFVRGLESLGERRPPQDPRRHPKKSWSDTINILLELKCTTACMESGTA